MITIRDYSYAVSNICLIKGYKEEYYVIYMIDHNYPCWHYLLELDYYRSFCFVGYCNPNRSALFISDGFLFYLAGRGAQKHGRRRVVRSREEVHSTLTIYHNEMNHLELEKCLKLISQHFFWGSMRADVGLWIQRCLQCSSSEEASAVGSCASPELPEPLESMMSQDR